MPRYTIIDGVVIPCTGVNNDIYTECTDYLIVSGDDSILKDALTQNNSDVASSVDEEKLSKEPVMVTYYYRYTYYDSVTGRESAPTRAVEVIRLPIGDIFKEVVDNELMGTSTKSKVSVVASSNPNVTNIRLYRLGGSNNQYSLVVELPNVTRVYTDKETDRTIASNPVLDTLGIIPPPVGLKYLSIHNVILFGAIEDKLYFSDIGFPDRWREINFIEFDDIITGIGSVQSGLLVFTKYKTYIVVGTRPEVFSKYLLSGEQGCVNHNSIAFVDNNLIWLSTDGICMSNGGVVSLHSRADLGKFNPHNISVPIAYNAVVYDSQYFLTTPNEIYIFDRRHTQSIIVLDIPNTTIGKFNDELYVNYTGKLHRLLDTDAPKETFTWKSPILTFGTYSTLKHFKDCYISFTGEVHMTLILDGNIILDKQLSSTTITTNTKSLGNRDGYGLEVILTGTGEVYELDISVVGRDNGK